MTCPTCGKPTQDGTRFCYHCGAPLAQDQVQTVLDQKAVQTVCSNGSAQTVPAQKSVQTAPAQAASPAPSPAQPQRSSRTLILVLAIALVVLVAAGAALIVYFIQDNRALERETSALEEELSEYEDAREEPEDLKGAAGESEQDLLQGVPVYPEMPEEPDPPATAPEAPQEQTPPPVSFDPAQPDPDQPYWGIDQFHGDVEQEVLRIRELYVAAEANISAGRCTAKTVNNVTGYFQNDQLCALYVPPSQEGEYRKFFYFEEGLELYFAYYEGQDAYRFYFWHENLIRWRYTPQTSNKDAAINYDLQTDQETWQWQNTVLADAYAYWSVLG